MNNKSSKSEVQAVIFFRKDEDDKIKWNVTTARKWLKDNNFKAIKKPDITLFSNQIRFRITPLEDKNGIPIYKRFTTKILKHADGSELDINLILGWKDDDKKKTLKKNLQISRNLRGKKKINLTKKKFKLKPMRVNLNKKKKLFT